MSCLWRVKPSARLHQVASPSRERAYHELDKAERALRDARRTGASPERLARLQQAAWDASQLHGDWKRADTHAALAGVWG